MTITRLLTADDLWNMEDDGYHYELVRGELLRMPPPGGRHGKLVMRLGWHLQSHVVQHPTGEVFSNAGFLLAQDPDIVRAPDLAFVRAERLPPEPEQEGYLPLAPDLAIEVVSPSDRAGQISEKVQDYLTAGVRRVWVLYPRRRTVDVHRPDGASRTLRHGDTLDGEDVLPGFHLPLTELFR